MAGRYGYFLTALLFVATQSFGAMGADPEQSDRAQATAMEESNQDIPAPPNRPSEHVENPLEPLPGDPEKRRKALENMPPDRRERLRKNFEHWKALPEERKKELRARYREHMERMRDEIEATCKDMGLDLDEARKREFAKRYYRERRRIEEMLRKEMDEKRRKLVQELRSRLKGEFGKESKPSENMEGDKKPQPPAEQVAPDPELKQEQPDS